MATHFQDLSTMASFLEPEATPRIQIIDADDSHFVIYKPKRQGRSSQKTNESKGFNTHDLEQGGSTINQGSTHEKPNRTKKKPSNLEKAGLTNRTSGAQEKPKRAKTKKTRLLSRDSMNVGDIDSQLMPTRWGARSPSKSKSPRVYPMVLDEQEQASAPGSPLECEGNLQGAGFFKQPTRSSARSKDISSKSERASSTARFSESSQIFSVTTPFFEKWRCRIRSAIKDMMRFKALKFTQILLAGCILFLTFADIGPPGGLRDTETGLIVDQASAERTEKGLILVNGTERAIVGATLFQVACIGIARASAWIMYPALVFVFISKFRATTSFLERTPLAMYMYSDSHELHVYCGWTIVIFSMIHVIFHIARWAQQGNLYLLVGHFSGLSGLFIILSCLLICIPMTIFRQYIRYEVRKNLHYLFIVFAGALIFHTPTSAIPNGGFTAYIFGLLLAWYFLDATYCYFFMTEKIDTTNFSVLPSGVRMTMNVSERFQKMGTQGGICYVCLPWVSKNQWHAFSLFENPSNPAERQIFIQKTGDWTTKVHRILQRDTVRPAWVHGPFPSPYGNADAYDNQILVASGIGITPALSVIRAHQNSRRINLIWAVRDLHLLEFFLRHLYLDHQGWNLIFYTGKQNLSGSTVDTKNNSNVCIIEGRPKLNELIPNIIYGIESGLGLPERYSPDTRATASEILADRLVNSSRSDATGSDEMTEDLACYASELGFHLPTQAILNEFMSSSDLQSGRGAKRCARRVSESIMGHLAIGFRPWDHRGGARKYVKQLDKKLVMPTWGMLYCGGAKPVLGELEKISDEYQICLHVESFAW